MKTTVIDKNGVQGATANGKEVKKEEVKNGVPAQNNGASKPEKEDGVTQPLQFEMKKPTLQEPVNTKLNLDETLKLVAELGRKKVHRDKLIETIDNLNDFKIELQDDADETGGDWLNGCFLTIEDDNGRVFKTKNPVIISIVAQKVNTMCLDKLAEIEASIILP